MSEGSSSNSRYVLYGVAALALILPQFYFWPHIADDSYITFRYVERWVSGQGLTFNPGERVEGFSSPLWVLLLSLFSMLGVEISTAARALGLLASLLAAALSLGYLKSNADHVPSYGIALALILATPGIHYFASSGMETPLAMLLLTATVYFWGRNNYMASAIAIGLAAVTRPELILHLLFWILLILSSKQHKKFFLIVVAIIPFAAWLCLRLIYFEAWLPNTALAKAGGVNLLGITTLTPFLLSLLGPIGIYLIWLAFRRDQIRIHDSRTLAILLVLASMIFVFYAPLDWMLFGRFFLPVWPLAAVLASIAFRPSLFNVSVRPIVLWIGFATMTLLVWQRPIKHYWQNVDLAMLMRGSDQLVVGRYVNDNLPRGSTIATGRLGAVSFAAPEMIFWDFMGLTDREVAVNKVEGKPNPILARKPDYMLHAAVPEVWGYENDTAMMRHMNEHYSLLRRFPQGNFGTFDLWARKRSDQ